MTLRVDRGESDLTAALQEHQANWDMAETIRGKNFADEPFLETPARDGQPAHKLSGLDFAPTPEVIEKMAAHKVATHAFAGYYDSGSVRGSLELASQLNSAGRSVGLTIGPWTHGARQTCSPWNTGKTTAPCYDIFEDVALFWDAYLGEEDNATQAVRSIHDVRERNQSAKQSRHNQRQHTTAMPPYICWWWSGALEWKCISLS